MNVTHRLGDRAMRKKLGPHPSDYYDEILLYIYDNQRIPIRNETGMTGVLLPNAKLISEETEIPRDLVEIALKFLSNADFVYSKQGDPGYGLGWGLCPNGINEVRSIIRFRRDKYRTWLERFFWVFIGVLLGGAIQVAVSYWKAPTSVLEIRYVPTHENRPHAPADGK